MKWTPTHVQILLWLAFQEAKTKNPNAKLISEIWPETNGESPSSRAVSEKLLSLKNGVIELGLAEFFGAGTSRPRPAPSRNKSTNSTATGVVTARRGVQQEGGKHLPLASTQFQLKTASSTQLQIGPPAQTNNGDEETSSSTQHRIATPAPSNGGREDDGTVADSDIDGETATESDTESDTIVTHPPSNPKRAFRIKKSSSESEAEAVEDSRPLPMKLRSLPKRTYKDSLDLDSEGEDSEVLARERAAKRPRPY